MYTERASLLNTCKNNCIEKIFEPILAKLLFSSLLLVVV